MISRGKNSWNRSIENSKTISGWDKLILIEARSLKRLERTVLGVRSWPKK